MQAETIYLHHFTTQIALQSFFVCNFAPHLRLKTIIAHGYRNVAFAQARRLALPPPIARKGDFDGGRQA
jgi:hypothetical protein